MWSLYREPTGQICPIFTLLALFAILLTMLSFYIFIGSFLVNIYVVQYISLKDGKMVFSEMWQFFRVFYSNFTIWGNLRHARSLQGFCKDVGGEKCGGQAGLSSGASKAVLAVAESFVRHSLKLKKGSFWKKWVKDSTGKPGRADSFCGEDAALL